MKPFPSRASSGVEFLRYKMNSQAGAVSFIAARIHDEKRKGETLVVPCQESFRTLNSVGTRRFKRALKEKTRFTGCEPLEADLVKDGLVLHHQREDTNPFLDGTGADAPPSAGLSLMAFSRLNLGERLATLRESYPDESLLFDDEAPNRSVLAPELTLQNLMAASPADLQAVTLMKLHEQGKFDPHGEEIKATAYLLFKGLSQKNVIEALFPRYPVEKFPALRAKVYEIYRKHRTRDEIVFERFNKSLTVKQRKALELVYMNDERKSFSEAAKQLGISVDTLKNRIEGGVKKLKAAFPEYAALKPEAPAPSNFKTDLAYDGFYRKSSAALIRPIKRFNPKTNAWDPIDMEMFLRSRKQRKKRAAHEAR